MAYLFSTSHLPAVRATRHAPEAQADDPGAHAPARSGMVHASSHLPQDPAGMDRVQIDGSDPLFAQHVRQAMRAEAAESPAAAALLRHLGTLPNKITIRPCRSGLARTTTDKDGNVTVQVNPRTMTGATMSHEFSHVVQQAHAYNALHKLQASGRTTDSRDYETAIQAGRDALNRLLPVKDARDPGQEHKENEAMRISNIVNAERTATGMQHLPPARKTSVEFWARQSQKQSAPRHQDNEQPLPAASQYGSYPFGYVRRVLSSGGSAHARSPGHG